MPTVAEILEGVPGFQGMEVEAVNDDIEEATQTPLPADVQGADARGAAMQTPVGRTRGVESSERPQSATGTSGEAEADVAAGAGHTHSMAAPKVVPPEFKAAGGELEVNPWTRQEDVGSESDPLTQLVKAVKEMLLRKGWFDKWTKWSSINDEVIRSVKMPSGLSISSQELFKVVKWASEEGCIKKQNSSRSTVMFAQVLRPAGRSVPGSAAASPAQKRMSTQMMPPPAPAGKGQMGGRGAGMGRGGYQPPRKTQ